MIENDVRKHNLERNSRPLLYSIILALGLSAGMYMSKEKKDKFSRIFEIIQNDYVDSTRKEVLEERAIDYLLSSLDPHSTYIPPQLTEVNERQIRGNYEGIGIEYIKFRDTLFVFHVIEGGPADKSGVKAGDRILMADNFRLTDTLSDTEIQEAIQGSGKSIDLLVLRRKGKALLKFRIQKTNIVMNSSEVYYMAGKTLGYMKLDRFSTNTHAEFMHSLESLQKEGMKDLILDLRNNGGGLLSEATAIANEFLQDDEIISYTYGFHRKKTFYKADGSGRFKEGKLILLINHNTASASEILAGCLQDNDRAVIIGNRSFGKGLVQEPFRLSDGSIIRLTIARYYTPSGRSIQKSYDKNLETYRNEIYSRDISSDTLNPMLDSSIKKEFFSKNGRILTPGGGIRPDIVLRDTISDSTEIERLMPGLYYSRIFDIYILDNFADLYDSKLNMFNDIDIFEKNYSVSQKDILRFITLALSLSYLKHLKYSIKTANLIKKHLKASLAYRLFGESGYSRIMNLEEGVFSKTYEVLKKYNSILNIGSRNTRKFDY